MLLQWLLLCSIVFLTTWQLDARPGRRSFYYFYNQTGNGYFSSPAAARPPQFPGFPPVAALQGQPQVGYPLNQTQLQRLIEAQQRDLAITSQLPDLPAGLLANGAQNRIINGAVVRSPRAYPYAIALLVQGKVYCGAALIRPDVAITAGHCLELGFRALTAYVGTFNLRARNAVGFPIVNAIRHVQYNDDTLENDIALLKFGQSFQMNRMVRTIPLPRPDQELAVGTVCAIVGWGLIRPNTPYNSDVLRETRVPVVPTAVCNDAWHYNGEVYAKMFCAGFEDGHTDACQGDSGGPLICPGDGGGAVLFGITSWGKDCGKPGQLGVYTQVSKHIDFIAGNINLL